MHFDEDWHTKLKYGGELDNGMVHAFRKEFIHKRASISGNHTPRGHH
jgi:hypothetical protein